MGAPHNERRYGELWPQRRIDLALPELEALRRHVVLSGGWAWHFMSPRGHAEYKHAHDHKDIDLMVPRASVDDAMAVLGERGFRRVWTRYDRLPSEEQFRRYEKVVEAPGGPPLRVVIDFFVRDVPERVMDEGWRVVEPETLLTFYSTIHGSRACFAVQAASRLIAAGVDPVGRAELCEVPVRGAQR